MSLLRTTKAHVGSPPYTWGAQKLEKYDLPDIGITPIYMGSTYRDGRWFRTTRDHPHIHGEHGLWGSSLIIPWGSPPYTWGAPSASLMIASRIRITPIYMGSTCSSGIARIGLEDHPHIHGEHQALAKTKSGNEGSPPYTWGAPRSALNSSIW